MNYRKISFMCHERKYCLDKLFQKLHGAMKTDLTKFLPCILGQQGLTLIFNFSQVLYRIQPTICYNK